MAGWSWPQGCARRVLFYFFFPCRRDGRYRQLSGLEGYYSRQVVGGVRLRKLVRYVPGDHRHQVHSDVMYNCCRKQTGRGLSQCSLGAIGKDHEHYNACNKEEKENDDT
ncbi:hypothetical protein NDU88_006301 [Pleurodeles waltl]|uniref:Secreted protein n=1 Tax=Pleurodeles waltl TaxID=8319 RepID=A0AAV7TWE9_PLEWA|nr:hypothetical protein NDU88_006301 [Pleurodeles waltl]